MTSPFSDLLELRVKPSRLVVGLMSGTSADSIDVAICWIKGQGGEIGVELLHYGEYDYDPDAKHQVLRASDLNLRAIAELNVSLGEGFASACLLSLDEASVSPAKVDLFGSHGQMVYHHSGVPGSSRATLQLGDGEVIAVGMGRHVISDLRSRDLAAGGEGAPFSCGRYYFIRRKENGCTLPQGHSKSSAGSPISPYFSTTTDRAFSGSTADRRTHRTIALGLFQCAELGSPVDEIIAAGGGVKSPALMERTEALIAPIPIQQSDDVGVPSDAREAMAFAVLADMTLRGMTACLPPITEATNPKLLGKLSFP